MKNHGLWMVLCCLLPMLLIFSLPVLGIREGNSIFLFIVAMFICHLLMMGGGHQHRGDEKKEGHHGCH